MYGKGKRAFALLFAVVIILHCCIIISYAESDNGDTIVYITETGEKYHRSYCGYLMSKIRITLREAVQQGYSPCSRCNPAIYNGSITPNETETTNNTNGISPWEAYKREREAAGEPLITTKNTETTEKPIATVAEKAPEIESAKNSNKMNIKIIAILIITFLILGAITVQIVNKVREREVNTKMKVGKIILAVLVFWVFFFAGGFILQIWNFLSFARYEPGSLGYTIFTVIANAGGCLVGIVLYQSIAQGCWKSLLINCILGFFISAALVVFQCIAAEISATKIVSYSLCSAAMIFGIFYAASEIKNASTKS